MQALELIREFRLHLDDLDPVDEDRLWTDEEVLFFLNQSINEFVQETEVIIDSSDAMTQLAVTADSPWITYDDRIIRFERLSYDIGTNRQLDIVSILNLQNNDHDYGFNFTSPRWMATKGQPHLLVSDMETQKLRLYPIPTANSTIACTVRRMPLVQFTQVEVDAGDEPEIPQRFHRKLLIYMKYMAYSKEDGETYDGQIMAKFALEWQKAISESKNRIERERGKRPRITRYRDPMTDSGSYGRRSHTRYLRGGY